MGEERRSRKVLELDLSKRVAGHRTGRLVGSSEEGLLVDYEGNPHGPVCARSTVALDAEAVAGLVREGREVLLAFVEQRSNQPVVIGLLQAAPGASPAPSGLELSVDGERRVIEARDEIVLRCGKASITLRRNGRVVLRGVYVETRAQGVNRIKGGVVKIN